LVELDEAANTEAASPRLVVPDPRRRAAGARLGPVGRFKQVTHGTSSREVITDFALPDDHLVQKF